MAILLVPVALASCAGAQGPRQADQQTVREWMKEISNWGRWGDDDQLGTLNLITPEKRRQALALVEDGVSVSLAYDTLKDETPDNPLPFGHEMLPTGSNNPGPFASDRYTVAYHGYARTSDDD